MWILAYLLNHESSFHRALSEGAEFFFLRSLVSESLEISASLTCSLALPYGRVIAVIAVVTLIGVRRCAREHAKLLCSALA
jgi:hypothetical protein